MDASTQFVPSTPLRIRIIRAAASSRSSTLAAIDELRAESVAFVFNTPNDKSRPGYLKMGWHEVGRVPVSISLRRLQSIPRVARSMRPAVKWSEPTAVGCGRAGRAARMRRR